MRPWMVWTLIGFGGLAGLVALVAVVGAMLPVAHRATATRVVRGAPDAVWGVVTDVAGFAAWRPGLAGVERLPERDGLPVWRESTRTGPMTLQVTALAPPRKMVTRIADEGLPFGGTWTYELAPEGTDTRVTLTEDGEIYNPIFRFVARFIMGYDGTMTAYLDGLERRMGGDAGG